jgi:hypothetical protein
LTLVISATRETSLTISTLIMSAVDAPRLANYFISCHLRCQTRKSLCYMGLSANQRRSPVAL